ncbi:MAG: pyridoxal phosphate-dependent aminotransferase [Bacteroidaceae bacterium]|nr:pyridoxal phosphate-dependent aminotransferase [Bacteroidaceae bacterium]
MQNMNKILNEMSSFIVMDILDKAKEMERKGIDVIHLEVGEPDFDVSENVSKSVIQAYAEHRTHYTSSLGDIELRKEIALLYKQEYNVEIKPEQILVTCGSSPAILFLMLMLCDNGSEVILSNPGYSCYKNFVLAAHAKPVYMPLYAEQGFQYNVEDIRQKITPNTAAIFINSPMNPTGAVLSEEFMKEVSTLGVPIISDEIYHGLVYEGKAHSILEYSDNAFVLNGFSKRFAMTGLRLGYLIAPMQYIPSLIKLQQNIMICAGSTAQRAGIAALRDRDDYTARTKKIYNERRLYMLDRLRSLGFDIPTAPQGAFYIFADAHKFTNDSLQFALDILENAHVGVTPGIDFGSRGEGYIRFSYANSIERIKEGLDRLEQYLSKLPKK